MSNHRKKRLLWLCRRGIREMDLLFKQLVTEQYDHLSSQQIDDLENLLNETDLDIVDWIMGRQSIPDERYQAFIQHMQTLHQKHLSDN